VTLGVRPEDVALDESNRQESGLVMEVALVEAVGGTCLVSLRRDGWEAVGRIGTGRLVQEGRKVGVMLNLERGHWFDAETGVALELGGSTA
jgi:ABC-type sugar transport system ATPase subunit